MTSIKLKLKPFTANYFDTLLSWVHSEKELKQWAGPTIFAWPLNKKQLEEYLAHIIEGIS